MKHRGWPDRRTEPVGTATHGIAVAATHGNGKVCVTTFSKTRAFHGLLP